MVVYTLLSPAYWPSYVVPPVALLALVSRGILMVLLVCDVVGIPSDRARRLALRR